MTTTTKRTVGTAEAARRIGVTSSGLITAEVRGSIPPAQRDPGSDDRAYTDADIERLRIYFER